MHQLRPPELCRQAGNLDLDSDMAKPRAAGRKIALLRQVCGSWIHTVDGLILPSEDNRLDSIPSYELKPPPSFAKPSGVLPDVLPDVSSQVIASESVQPPAQRISSIPVTVCCDFNWMLPGYCELVCQQRMHSASSHSQSTPGHSTCLLPGPCERACPTSGTALGMYSGRLSGHCLLPF